LIDEALEKLADDNPAAFGTVSEWAGSPASVESLVTKRHVGGQTSLPR
jgi:hypothetical protein